jgi:hypothetical protein
LFASRWQRDPADTRTLTEQPASTPDL